MQPTPSHDEILSAVDSAAAAVGASIALRESFRGKKRLDRRDHLEPALARMAAAGAALRRLRGMELAHPISEEDAKSMRRLSADLTLERRKLKKMIDASPGRPR